MRKKISVIVPCFNVEEYLEDCLNSLVKQTIFDDLEIVCIDDGSTDSTLKILEQYKFKYSNIIVVSQDNQGQSSARNAGLKLATGKYIGFIDSDDIINEVYYENLVETIEKHQADLVVCKLVTLYDNGSVDETNAREYMVDDFVKIDSNFDDKIKLFLNDKLSVSPCNKLIKRSI
jgi:glycosyltransferase involved in cell wall biosynthesis